MKIKVEPGRVIRLTSTKNTSSHGGEFDLAKLGLADKQIAAILKLDGVAEVKTATKAKGGDS